MRLRLAWIGALLAATMVATAITAVVLTGREAGDELRDILDDDLEMQAVLLARLLGAERGREPREALDALLRRTFRPDEEETLWVNVYDTTTGRLASNMAHELPLGDPAAREVRLRHDGFGWEGFQRREGPLVVQLLRRTDLYGEASSDVVEEIVLPVVLGGAVNLALLALLLGLSVWPLARLARELGGRSPDSLAPLDAGGTTAEIALLRDRLNALMAGIDATLRRERQFASDLAHELRTPLTTLKLELAGADPDLAAVRSEVDRLARLAAQLLVLARLEQGRWRDGFRPVDLAELAEREVARQATRFARPGIDVQAAVAPAIVQGEPTLLAALVQNLLNNVADHCPAGTRAVVATGTLAGRPFLEVRDDGPGMDAVLRGQLGREVTRLDSRSHGLGIGLAICQRIAGAHGATLAFEPATGDGRGLAVRLEWPS